MRIAYALALVCVMSWQVGVQHVASAVPGCSPGAQTLMTLPGRVDALLAAPATATAMALVGRPGSRVRYLPHDSITVFHAGQQASAVRTLPLPPYLTAPGLAAGADGKRLYVLADSTLLTLDGVTGRVTAQQDLGMQAIGWPAAITIDIQGVIYLIGQPAGALTDQADAFGPDSRGLLRLRWQTSLGVTHAGTWIGLGRGHTLAAYTPDQQDVHGTVTLLDLTGGGMLRSYGLPVPPVADDANQDRIYVAEAGVIGAFTLSSGQSVAAAHGTTPLAVNAGKGLVAFLNDGHIVLADTRTLRTVRRLPFPGGMPPTALAWQSSNLLVGMDHAVSRIRLDACR